LKKKLIIIGGGAAGYFTAINAAEQSDQLDITIIEQNKESLNKVRISGGGRCNVTNTCSDPKILAGNYPRGNKALIGPFHSFNSADTVQWFEDRGVELKAEADGRMFPVSDQSSTVIDCFHELCKVHNITIKLSEKVVVFQFVNDQWHISTNKSKYKGDFIMIAAGSSTTFWNHLSNLGHKIVPPVPSLFTFNTKDTRLRDLSGLSVANVEVSISDTKIITNGPLLITHWGMSGPAILKASAWAARHLYDCNYKFTISIDWLPTMDAEKWKALKIEMGNKFVLSNAITLPQRLWKSILSGHVKEDQRWSDLSNVKLEEIYNLLKYSIFDINGKSTFKEEFVTAGGVDLDEVNFKSFSSKLHPRMYLAGEILDIDAVTGGFNFQAAWTGGYLAAMDIVKRGEM